MEHPPPSRLICPIIRLRYSYFLSASIRVNESYFSMIDISYSSHDVSSDDDHRLVHRLDPLYWCNNKKSRDEPSWCGACECNESSTTYYYCNECKVSYHKECVESSPLIKSPHHPKHRLQLIMRSASTISPDVDSKILPCSYCGSSNGGNCLRYYCYICELSLDPLCAIRTSFLNYQKRHEHTLNHFPRKTDLICDVCGLVDSKTLIYVCLECGFVVHTKCIYLPFVIRISRHNHRLSFTYSPSIKLPCGVCHQKVGPNYGKYYCTKDCTYVVHSKCATREDVWDGKELEQEPEEDGKYENLNSFEVIGDGIIQHFSHSHCMRFEKNTSNILMYDEKNKCHACILPVYDGGIYKCIDSTCDFVLHEACANLPRTKHHIANPYPFILQVSDTEVFFCRYCNRLSCGFRYVCSEGGESINLDVRCAAISEPFDHQLHPHPLFLSNEFGIYKPCSMCEKSSFRTLNCIECDFSLCFYCATLPYKVRYEHDEHFLIFSYEGNASLSWCEICEETLDSSKWFYTCKECGVAFHIKCLLGKCAFYVKPAQNLLFDGGKFNIFLSNGLTRPICNECQRCFQDKLMIQFLDDDDQEIIACYRHWEVRRT